jgi:hypothetical protein
VRFATKRWSSALDRNVYTLCVPNQPEVPRAIRALRCGLA